ncbi:MAG TPA: energy transducer TonB [Longimicrobium sp.]|nr:energy transducer TonB [Longimicrobium sp.]
MSLRVSALALTLLMGAAAPLHAQVPATRTSADSALRQNSDRRIRTAFREAMAAHGIANPDALLLLTRGQPGSRVEIQVLEGTVPQPVLAALDSVVQNQIGPWPDPYLTTTLRPEPPREADELIRVTPPELRNRGFISEQLGRYLARNPEVGIPGQRIDMRVRALVSRTGAIPYVELTQSSGRLQIDQEVMRIVRQMQGRPARIGDTPVDIWITVPVTLQPPRQLPPQDDPSRPRMP